jgi:hypothetical protein
MGLTALPFLLLATTGVTPPAQLPVCYAVQPGDTAARFALRLTGSADNVYAPWFHVVDTSARSVPKSQYSHILPGWRVCVPGASRRAAPVAIALVQQHRPLIDPMLLRYGAAGLILVAALLAFLVVLQILGERQIILDRMKAFGERFVNEFETPLFRYPARRPNRHDGHPVRSRLRFSPHRERMEILLAPLDGRTYPNLSDHRKNLEYDIERVMNLLGAQPFTTGQLRAEGRWVVIPFRLYQRPRPQAPGPRPQAQQNVTMKGNGVR